MRIAVLQETASGESRVAATPETVKKFIALGATVAVQPGAGAGASIADADYAAAGAEIAKDAVKGAQIVLGVQGPDPKALKGAADGKGWAVVGMGHSTRWLVVVATTSSTFSRRRMSERRRSLARRKTRPTTRARLARLPSLSMTRNSRR